jgi:hypothetical protein
MRRWAFAIFSSSPAASNTSARSSAPRLRSVRITSSTAQRADHLLDHLGRKLASGLPVSARLDPLEVERADLAALAQLTHRPLGDCAIALLGKLEGLESVAEGLGLIADGPDLLARDAEGLARAQVARFEGDGEFIQAEWLLHSDLLVLWRDHPTGAPDGGPVGRESLKAAQRGLEAHHTVWWRSDSEEPLLLDRPLSSEDGQVERLANVGGYL